MTEIKTIDGGQKDALLKRAKVKKKYNNNNDVRTNKQLELELELEYHLFPGECSSCKVAKPAFVQNCSFELSRLYQ